MLRRLICFTLVLSCILPLSAQRLAVGEKVPEVRAAAWHNGNAPVGGGKAMLLDFFHSANQQCVKALPRINDIYSKYGNSLNVIVLSRESLDKTASYSANYGFYSGQDEDGKTFNAYDVRYVPFTVLTDSRGRLVWMGNIAGLTDSIIDKALK